jgi:hypothetical protein
MPTDRYTKSVLTVIAAALVVLAVQNASKTATAQQQPGAMCTVLSPCYVKNDGITPLNVVEARTSGQGGSPIRGISPNSGQLK